MREVCEVERKTGRFPANLAYKISEGLLELRWLVTILARETVLFDMKY